MHLRHGESIVMLVKRHRTPFVFRVVKICILTLPLYLILYFIGRATGSDWVFVGFAAVSFLLGIVIAMIAIDFLFDRLILTDKRIVWVDWQSLLRKEEHEVELLDVQDVEILEKGILPKFPLFHYGSLIIETAASKTAITFHDCPSPEKVDHLIIMESEKLRNAV